MPMTYDEYDSKRSWLVDTAETPADKKRLKAELQKLKAQYEAGKAKSKSSPTAKTADAARMQATQRAQMLRGESAEDKAYRTLMEKYNYDVTKIPGFKGGKGTR